MTRSNIFGRLDEMELKFNNVLESVNQNAQRQKTLEAYCVNELLKLENLPLTLIKFGDILNALVQVQSEEQKKSIEDKVEEFQLNREIALATKSKELLADALAKGEIEPKETITEKSVIEGKEYLEDGTEVVPGYNQNAFEQLPKEVQQELLGKSVGYELSYKGYKVKITGIYESVKKEPAK